MKGGARVRSGPPADPNAIKPAEFTELPSGRAAAAPPWPLVPTATKRESQIWAELWRKPQGDQWERRGLEREVAFHVRTAAAVERMRPAPASMLAEIRRQSDSLGLSIAGYRAAKFVPQANPEPRAERRLATGTEGARWKPEVIDGGS